MHKCHRANLTSPKHHISSINKLCQYNWPRNENRSDKFKSRKVSATYSDYMVRPKPHRHGPRTLNSLDQVGPDCSRNQRQAGLLASHRVDCTVVITRAIRDRSPHHLPSTAATHDRCFTRKPTLTAAGGLQQLSDVP